MNADCNQFPEPVVWVVFSENKVEFQITRCFYSYWHPILKMDIEEFEKVENYYDLIENACKTYSNTTCEWLHKGCICNSDKPIKLHKVYLSIDARCNAACRFCVTKQTRAALSYSTAKTRILKINERIINDLRNHNISICLNSAGDSLMDIGLAKKVLSDGGFNEIFLMTNGINLTSEVVDAINKSDSEVHLQVSLNSYDRKSYFKVMRANKWDLVYKNILNAPVELITFVIDDSVKLRKFKNIFKLFDGSKIRLVFNIDSNSQLNSKRRQKFVDKLNKKAKEMFIYKGDNEQWGAALINM